MALKKFIGARYAPEFAGAWSNAKQYAALSVVYADNRSYVSRKTVPAGTPITNTEFWIQSSDWNAQVAEYNLKVEGYNANVEQYNRNVQDYSAEVRGFYADTLHSFDTKADMQADRTLALGETLLTCGDKKIGDGGGSFYQVVSETSVTAVALDNGLFAEPFEFQPYDYSQFQQEVEGYKDSTTRVYNTQQDMVADVGINAGNILMTAGALEQGDGQGSFWNVTSNQEEGSVLLKNGKYAKKFNVSSVNASGTLLFNNKGNQVAIWGVKAGGEMVNIPVSYSLGETRNVFVAVEYDSDNTNATVNLVVSGPVSFTQAFAWSDASVTSGQVKTVIYAITMNSKGNSVYTGAQVAASYLTTLTKFMQAITANVPDAINALNEWNGNSVSNLIVFFTVNKTIMLTKIAQNNPSWFKASKPEFSIASSDNKTRSLFYEYGTTGNLVHDFILEPGVTYSMFFGRVGSVGDSFNQPKESITGTYGPFTFNSQKYQGQLNYMTPTLSADKSVQIQPSIGLWTNETTNNNLYVPFTVNKPTRITSFTYNHPKKNGSPVQADITTRTYPSAAPFYLFGYTGTETSKTVDCSAVLMPGTQYYFAFSNTTRMAQPISGTFGNFIFDNAPYAGTIHYQDIDY